MDPLTIQTSLDLIEEGPRRSSRLRVQDSGSERENIDVNKSNPIQSQRGKQLNIAQRQSTRPRKKPTGETEMLKPVRGHAPEYNYLPPVVNSSISFPIPVTREKLNCAFGNDVSLLTYINHLNTGLKCKLFILRTKSKVCDIKEISVCLHHCGYDIMLFHQFQVILACRLL